MRSNVFLLCSILLLSLPGIFGAPVTEASNANGKLETSNMIAHAGGYPHRGPNSTINFTFNDPNTNDPTSCNLTWPAASAPPSTVYGCSDSIYRFSFPSFKSIAEFQLQLAHSFQYDALGPPPDNYLTVFATLNITKSENYTCSPSGMSCYMPDGMGPLIGIVTAVTG